MTQKTTPNPDQRVSESTPKGLCTLAMLLSLIAGLSALPWMYLAIGRFGGFAWGLFGFEFIVLLGAIMTIFVAIGRVRVGAAFPMAMACMGGTLLVTSVFGIHVDARNVVGTNHPDIAPWVNRTLMLYLALIAGFSLLAMLDVYRRTAQAWGLVLRAAMFLIPVLAVLVYVRSRGMPSITDASGELSVVSMIGVILGGLFFGILLSVGGHFLIRSFEVAMPEKTAPQDA